MLALCSTVADHLLEIFVPKTTAGACACGGSYCSTIPCPGSSHWRIYTNCQCQQIKKVCRDHDCP
jgi:hypothetical protein